MCYNTKGCIFMAKYKIEFKKEVVEYYKVYGKNATMTKYKVSDGIIYKWNHQYDALGVEGFKRKPTKYYSVSEKVEIIEFFKHNGPFETYKKFNVSKSVVYQWERKLIENGTEALAKDNRGRKVNNLIKDDVNLNEDLLEEVQRLRMENAYLKKLKALVQQREEKQNKKK